MDNNCGCQNSRNRLLNEIMSYNFAINDLALYLDTHNTDSRAICLHNEYCQKVDKLINEYERLYGPLTINSISDRWSWADEPWPWERRNY